MLAEDKDFWVTKKGPPSKQHEHQIDLNCSCTQAPQIWHYTYGPTKEYWVGEFTVFIASSMKPTLWEGGINYFIPQICLLPNQPQEMAWVWSSQGLAFLTFLARAHKGAQSPRWIISSSKPSHCCTRSWLNLNFHMKYGTPLATLINLTDKSVLFASYSI